MATAFSTVHALLILFSITSLVSLATATAVTATTTAVAHGIQKPQKLVIKLIHINSNLSPHYNQNTTISDHAEQTSKTSTAHFNYLKTKIQTNSAIHDAHKYSFNGVADKIGIQFLAKIHIGDPPSPQLVPLVTAGDLLWIQCLPCSSFFNQSTPIFDPSKSSTFTNLSCQSPLCFSTGGHCNSNDPCPYSVQYNDGVISTGTLAQDYITFNDNTMTTIPLVFGCGHENVGTTDGQASGILGLAPGNVSLVSQMGSKFSHCFGNVSDPKYTHNQLVLGDGAEFLGSSTPLDPSNELYYVTLEGISVGKNRLIIDPYSFKRTPSGNGGVILDSGVPETGLTSGAFNPLSDEVKRLLSGKGLVQATSSGSSSQLCYKGSVGQNLNEFPTVKFHFANGTNLVVDKWGMFQQTKPDEFCLAVVDSTAVGFSAIGLLAQQFHNIGYDIISQKVYFKRINCENLYKTN